MDVIEGFGERPGFFSIVDLELAVWRYPGRLNGGKVGTNDLTGRLFFGELNSPNSSSSSDVKDIQAVSGNGGKVEGAVE